MTSTLLTFPLILTHKRLANRHHHQALDNQNIPYYTHKELPHLLSFLAYLF